MHTPHHVPLATFAQRLVAAAAALLLLFFSPAPYVFADGGPSANTCNAPAPANSSRPTGSDAVTYTYNSCTGLWENAYYTWDPTTQEATPKQPPVYTCNTTQWKWQTAVWVYDPAAGKFDRFTVSAKNLPVGAIVAPNSANPCAPPVVPPSASSGTTGVPTANSSNGTPSGAADPTVTTATSGSTALSADTTATVHNTVGTQATSGAVQIAGNTTGGNATSGDATDVANVINALQSSSSLTSQPVATFQANINGDVQGDLVIDPSALQPASSDAPLGNTNLTVNNQTSGAIANNITAAAQSGNAAVTDNTTGGNATSGNATAVADVVNMLNSIVSAGKSFIGVININGNLNGNILVPQHFLDTLLASNAPTATLTLTPSQAATLGITNTNNLNTTNNVTSSATTGQATVSGNTTAGNVTSGNASTDVTVFNLTGNQVIAANALLVFVNVSGQWVGMILNAPQGATAAAFGSGVAQDAVNTAAAVTNNTNGSITNNITAAAQSGNAAVTDNTTGGNATSGNANTAVNLLNLNNASFTLSGWFGILFINVFGNWYGNFGVYAPPAASGQASVPSGTAAAPSQQPAPKHAFQFIPSTPAPATNTDTPLTTLSGQLVSTAGAVLGDGISHVTAPVASHDTKPAAGFQIVDLLLIASGAGLFVAERITNRRARASRSAS